MKLLLLFKLFMQIIDTTLIATVTINKNTVKRSNFTRIFKFFNINTPYFLKLVCNFKFYYITLSTGNQEKEGIIYLIFHIFSYIPQKLICANIFLQIPCGAKDGCTNSLVRCQIPVPEGQLPGLLFRHLPPPDESQSDGT